MTEIARQGRERSPYPRFLACGSRCSPGKARSISLLSHHCLERFWRPTVTDRPECDPSEDGGSEGWHKMVTTGFADLTHEDRHCQVDEKLVDRPPRYWAPARLERAMLGIRNTRQPQLDNTAEGVDFPRYLLRLTELELLDRERRATERRIHQARFEVVKSLDSFDFLALPSLNKALVLELARGEFIERKENILALGNSGTGKTHIALALGLAACQKGFRVRFTTAASLAHELIEANDERRLMRFQKMLSSFELLIIDELGFVPLSKTGAELLFEVFSRRYERSATVVTSNLPFNEWTQAFGSERLTGALLDRLTHHVHILEMNGESYRLKDSKRRRSGKPRA